MNPSQSIMAQSILYLQFTVVHHALCIRSGVRIRVRVRVRVGPSVRVKARPRITVMVRVRPCDKLKRLPL